MARTGLSSTDVTTAYDALIDKGIQPSIRAIRAHLGNTGSLKTIADHVRVLKSERWQAPGLALPDPLMQSLVTGAEAFWSELAEAADAHIEANNAQCNSQLDAMRAERDEAQNKEASMRDALSACKAHIATLESQLGESTDRLKTTLHTLKSAQEQSDRVQAQVKELSTAMHELTKERDDAQRLASESQRSIMALKDQLSSVEYDHLTMQLARDKEDNAMSQELEDVRAALATATHTLTQWVSRHEQWELDRESMREQISKLQKTIVSDQDRMSELQQVATTLQSENAALAAQLDVTRSMATDAETRQQSMLKALSAEFATVVREAQSEIKSSPKPSSEQVSDGKPQT